VIYARGLQWSGNTRYGFQSPPRHCSHVHCDSVPRLKRLYERMAALQKGLRCERCHFVGINRKQGRKVWKKSRITAERTRLFVTILKDWNNVVADKLGASVTPEIYVLNSNFEILTTAGSTTPTGEQSRFEDLRNALDLALGGKPIEVRETKAFGCTIKRVQ